MSAIQGHARGASVGNPEPSVPADRKDAYRVHFHIVPEDDGTYSAVALNLPGAGSCGDTVAAAVENATEAVHGILESYLADGEKIPWADSSAMSVPDGDEQTWVTVHV
jgi:predicted RNase H-like HicB family nuclease